MPGTDSTCSPRARQQRAPCTLAVPGRSGRQVGLHTVQSTALPNRRRFGVPRGGGQQKVPRAPKLGNFGTRLLRQQGTDEAGHCQEASANWRDGGKARDLRIKSHSNIEAGRNRLQRRGKARPCTAPALRPGDCTEARTPQTLRRKETKGDVIPEHGQLAAGSPDPASAFDRREAEGGAPGRTRAATAQRTV